MEEGDVIRFALQQNDGKYVKRPAVILKKILPYNDCVICGISKSIGLEVKGLDMVILQNDSDFKTWGLNYPGVIRTGFLFTISTKYIEGSLGNISLTTLRTLRNNLAVYISK